MVLLGKLSNSCGVLLRKMGKLKTKGREELPFPTTGIIGVIAGDCFGAAYEFHPVKHGDFDIYKEPRFTDDTVMTLAVAKWLTIDPEHTHEKLVECMKELGRKAEQRGGRHMGAVWILPVKGEAIWSKRKQSNETVQTE